MVTVRHFLLFRMATKTVSNATRCFYFVTFSFRPSHQWRLNVSQSLRKIKKKQDKKLLFKQNSLVVRDILKRKMLDDNNNIRISAYITVIYTSVIMYKTVEKAKAV